MNNNRMNNKIATAGNAGPKVRSDCEMTLEIRQKGGIVIDLKSKVKALYGESIKTLCREVLSFYNVRNAILSIDDSGALPFVLAARLEAVIRMLTGSDSEFLIPMIRENLYKTAAGRTRFSRLYLPGNNPGLMINAGLHSAHGIILDLEDSVAPGKKDEARILVRNALRQIDFRGAERMVRINQGETGLIDLRSVIPQNVNLILIPKCESADQVKQTDEWISEIRKRNKIRNNIYLMPIIENALGVENSFSIASASGNVVAIAIGLEDFTADLGVQRTFEGTESLFARSRLVVAAKAARVQPIDSVFSDVGDIQGLEQTVLKSRALGFEGMGCIHPRQIRIINEGYSPDEADIDKARKIVLAFEEASAKGLAVVALGTKMIDAPVVERARRTISLAEKLGQLPGNWRKL
jgi:citrate lyase subunit beta/citryl-CoA lyase